MTDSTRLEIQLAFFDAHVKNFQCAISEDDIIDAYDQCDDLEHYINCIRYELKKQITKAVKA